jgi:nucleotide sugar dehydrogenase
MTLKLALQGLLTERSIEPDVGETVTQESIEDGIAGTISEPTGAKDTVEELAVAIGSAVERAAVKSAPVEPTVDEDTVGELAMAMGAVFERALDERTAIKPTVEADTVAQPAAAEMTAAYRDLVETDAHGAAIDDRVVEGGADCERAASKPAIEATVTEFSDADSAIVEGLDQMVVAVVGLRAAGLPAAIALRSADARVIGIDPSSSRLADIHSGRAGLSSSKQEEMRRHLAGGGFVLTERVETLAAAEAVLICVPTPTNRERRPDTEPLRRACAEVVAHTQPGQTLVLTSTTYVGSTRELLVEPLEARGLRVGEDVFVAFSPERVDPGAAEHEALKMPRVLGAVTERCYEHASELLGPICKELHRVSSPQAAEMTKLYENTFRTVNIALAFEMADACRVHGLDSIEVTDAAASKPFGFLAHYPSAGVGGGIGVDPYHLTLPLRGGSRPATITEDALRKVAARPRQVVWRAQELLSLSGVQLGEARVLVVGASYKPGIASTSHSPAVEIITKLVAEGLQVDYHDPLVPELRIDDEMLCGVDPDPRRDASGFGPEDYALAIVVTLHPGHDYGWLRRVPDVLDCTYCTPGGRRRFLP